MGEGKEENAIVTSTGQYVVAWDFAKVKKGQLDKYEIKWCVLPSAIPALLHPADAPRFLTGTRTRSSRTTSGSATTRKSYVPPHVAYCSEPT